MYSLGCASAAAGILILAFDCCHWTGVLLELLKLGGDEPKYSKVSNKRGVLIIFR